MRKVTRWVVLLACGTGCADVLGITGGQPADGGAKGDAAPACVPSAQCGAAKCGDVPDGCNGRVSCGMCVTPEFCGGGGANQCGTTPCTPKTAMACTPMDCGKTISDGCSSTVQCPACAEDGGVVPLPDGAPPIPDGGPPDGPEDVLVPPKWDAMMSIDGS